MALLVRVGTGLHWNGKKEQNVCMPFTAHLDKATHQ